jgi:hypothetical protein
MLGLGDDQVCNFPENALLLERLRNHWLTEREREREREMQAEDEEEEEEEEVT